MLSGRARAPCSGRVPGRHVCTLHEGKTDPGAFFARGPRALLHDGPRLLDLHAMVVWSGRLEEAGSLDEGHAVCAGSHGVCHLRPKQRTNGQGT
jgi:hypothetical protein